MKNKNILLIMAMGVISELDTPTIAPVMPMKNKHWNGLASQARHKMVAPSAVVHFANRGLGYEPSESSPTSN
jgi:hypothetical protein